MNVPDTSSNTRLPRRRYGKEAIPLSILGFPGIMLTIMDESSAREIVAEAVERGVNYFDVAPTYGDAEVKLGPALQPYRKDVFLACKTTQHARDGAAAELKRSLERLCTDRLDLYQLHALADVEKDVDAVFAKGGAMETFLEAKRSGQVRHVGFSAHTEAAALAALERYDFDSVLFPLNFACWHKHNFGPRVAEAARRKGATLLALKAMAREKWPEDDPDRARYKPCWYKPLVDAGEIALALRFTWGVPVVAAVSAGHPELFRMALDAAAAPSPLNADEEATLLSLARSLNPIFDPPAD